MSTLADWMVNNHVGLPVDTCDYADLFTIVTFEFNFTVVGNCS